MLYLLGHPGHQLPSSLIPSDSDSRSQTFLGWVKSRPELKPGGLRLSATKGSSTDVSVDSSDTVDPGKMTKPLFSK